MWEMRQQTLLMHQRQKKEASQLAMLV